MERYTRAAEIKRLMAFINGEGEPLQLLPVDRPETSGPHPRFWFNVDGDAHFDRFAKSRRTWATSCVSYVTQPDGILARCLSTEGAAFYVSWLWEQGIIVKATYDQLCDHIEACVCEERRDVQPRCEDFWALRQRILAEQIGERDAGMGA